MIRQEGIVTGLKDPPRTIFGSAGGYIERPRWSTARALNVDGRNYEVIGEGYGPHLAGGH